MIVYSLVIRQWSLRLSKRRAKNEFENLQFNFRVFHMDIYCYLNMGRYSYKK